MALQGAEGAVVVELDLAAVAEEVFVEEVLGVVGADVAHGDGEAAVGVAVGEGIGVGAGLGGVAEAFGVVGEVEGDEPAAFDEAEALGEPLLADEVLDEEGLGGALGGEVSEDGGFEGVEFGLGFEGEDDGFGGEAVLERVELDGVFAGGGAGTGGSLGVAAVGGALFWGGHCGWNLQLEDRAEAQVLGRSAGACRAVNDCIVDGYRFFEFS